MTITQPTAGEDITDTWTGDVTDLLTALTGMPAPTTTSSNGTVTSGTTETRDAVLGNYTFTVPAAGALWRYRVIFSTRLSFTAADDVFLVNVRDGGSSTPTASSTLVAKGADVARVTGGPGQTSIVAVGNWVPGTGTHTLSAFVQRINGTGTATPVDTRSLSAEFYRTS